MLSHLMLYLIILLTDVIAKVTVADLITTFILADVIAIIMWDGVITHLLMKYYMLTIWQMLLPMILSWYMLKPLFGPVYVLADVIAIVADAIATVLQIGLYNNGSWCYCYLFMIDWLMLLPRWLMLMPLSL